MSDPVSIISLMDNGTFVMTELGLEALMKSHGYWVAYQEISMDEITLGDTVGIWTDSLTGKTWVDKSMHVNDLGTAMLLGRMYSQQAIFDIVNQKEIRLC